MFGHPGGRRCTLRVRHCCSRTSPSGAGWVQPFFSAGRALKSCSSTLKGRQKRALCVSVQVTVRSVQVTVRTTAMVLMISIVWPASLLIRGCSPQTMRPDCMRTRRGWPDMVNMSIGSVCPNSLVVYRDLQAQQKVPQNMLMDRLLDQIVGGIEKENKLLEKENMLHTENQVLLEKQLRQIATGTPAA